MQGRGVRRRQGYVVRACASVVATAVTALVVVGGVTAASASISTDQPEPVAMEVNAALDAVGIMPGVAVDRLMTLRLRPNRPVSTVTLSVVADESSVLDQDRANGLQLSADSCDRPWRDAGTGLVCDGSPVEVTARRPIVGTSGLGALHLFHGAPVDYLRLRISLPASAGVDLLGQSSALRYRVAAF
jgi:hypothetical protein